MANTSATGGYLSPAASALPLEGDALDALLQSMVVGITGLPGAMVRPRWQSVVPKQPEPSVDWCAIGITTGERTDYPVESHNGTGDGSDLLQRWEEFTVLASFYGPNAMSFADLLRDGIYVPQNREAMQAQGMDLIDAGSRTTASDLVNQQWVRRYDLPVRIRRKSERTYPVLNIVSADDLIVTDSH